MAWFSCLLLSYFVTTTVSAPSIQYPFQEANSAAWAQLRRSVGDLLIEGYPIGSPCYESSFDEDKCVAVNKSKSSDEWVSDQPGGYFYGNWASCQATAESCALPLPVDPKQNVSNTATALPGTCHRGNVPEYMVKVKNADHIQAVFKFAKDTKMPLVVRNTGHDWKGRSAGSNSLAIWTHDLRHPHVPRVFAPNFVPFGCQNYTPENVTHFGGGETWGNAYQFADNHSVAILGGTCGTVGIAGWLSGGGHSPFTPHLGMGVDNVRQVEIVTPKGEVKIANKCFNKDLFFAVRGGGGGTFGVVTKITYKTFPKFEVQQFSADLTKMSEPVLKNFLEIATASALDWAQQGWGGYIKPSVYLEIVKATGTQAEAKSDMSKMVSFMVENGIPHYFRSHASSYQWQKEVWGAPEKHVGAWSMIAASRLLPRGAFKAQNRTELVKTLASLERAKLNPLLMLVTPTTFNHTTDSALHPSWQHAIWSVRINNRWDQFKAADTPKDTRKRFQEVHEALRPIRDLAPDMGVSIPEADIWEEDHEKVFWGEERYKNLTKVKNDTDPEGLMSNWQAVGFNPSLERFKCYPKSTD